MTLDGSVAIVTGAAGFLGSSHCRALAGAGATVVAADLDREAAAEAVSGLDGDHLAVSLDVTDEGSVSTAVKEAMEVSGRIDALVNDAAVNDAVEAPELSGEVSRLETFPVETFRRSMDVNVTGTFLISRAVGTRMAETGGGSIVTIASTYGLVGPDQRLYVDDDGVQRFFKSPAYPTSKGAVIALTRALAAYWGPAGVRVNSLSPGGVENGQDEAFVQRYADRTPLGRMARPEDYDGAIVFLASDASRYMTGANLVVDGGWTAW